LSELNLIDFSDNRDVFIDFKEK